MCDARAYCESCYCTRKHSKLHSIIRPVHSPDSSLTWPAQHIARRDSLILFTAASYTLEACGGMSANQRLLPQLSGCFDPAPISEGSEDLMCCEFSNDGNLLAVGTTAGTVTVYQSSTGKAIYHLPSLQHPRLPVTAVRFFGTSENTKTDNMLLVSYAAGHIRHWHVSTKQCLSTISEDRHTLAARLAPDYLTFATAGSDSKVYIYDEPTKKIQAVLEPSMSATVMDGHMSRIFGLAYHPHDPRLLVSAGWDDTVQFWDTRQSHSIRKICGPHVCGDALDIEPSSLNIVTGSWRKQNPLQVWDFDSGKLITTLQPSLQSKLYAACWMSSDVILAGGSQENIALLVNSKANKVLGEVAGLDHGVYGVAHHQQKVAIVAGATMYTVTVNTRV